MTTLFLIVSIVLALALVGASVFLVHGFLMMLVQFIRPPSITIGSVQPLTGSGVRQFITTFAESILTRRIFVGFSYERRNTS